ncbi:hypothetical protein ACNKHO_15260 [Shigella flexneri]
MAQALAGEEMNRCRTNPRDRRRFHPGNLNLKLIDKVVAITNEEAISTARRLNGRKGILAGISSGAAVAAALKT